MCGTRTTLTWLKSGISQKDVRVTEYPAEKKRRGSRRQVDVLNRVCLDMRLVPTPPSRLAAPLWDDLIDWMEARFPTGDYPLIVVDWWPLYAQALLSHDAGAREASAMACRAALEAIGWSLVTWRPTGIVSWNSDPPLSPRGGPAVPLFPVIERTLREEQALDEAHYQLFLRIKERGDAAAHLAQRSYHWLQTRSTNPTQPPTDLARGMNAPWMTADEAWENLHDAASVFKRLLEFAQSVRYRQGASHGQD